MSEGCDEIGRTPHNEPALSGTHKEILPKNGNAHPSPIDSPTKKPCGRPLPTSERQTHPGALILALQFVRIAARSASDGGLCVRVELGELIPRMSIVHALQLCLLSKSSPLPLHSLHAL